MLIVEKTRNQLVSTSKQADKERDGKTRYDKRLSSRIGSSVSQYQKMDMNKLFKEDILDLNVQVYGETDNYIVIISFGEILEILQGLVNKTGQLTLKDVERAISYAFNYGDVYSHCTCPDFQFRQNYWATKKGINAGQPEIRPSDKTNPRDTLGDGCKHILKVLTDSSWIRIVARVIFNYINYMEIHQKRLYATFIYPTIYGKKYEEPVQLDMDKDELDSSEDNIGKANAYAKEKNRFKQGNTQGIRFAPEDDKQLKINVED